MGGRAVRGRGEGGNCGGGDGGGGRYMNDCEQQPHVHWLVDGWVGMMAMGGHDGAGAGDGDERGGGGNNLR